MAQDMRPVDFTRAGFVAAIVKLDDIGRIVGAGGDTLVAGSAVFGAPDNDGGYRSILQQLRKNSAPAT